MLERVKANRRKPSAEWWMETSYRGDESGVRAAEDKDRDQSS